MAASVPSPDYDATVVGGGPAGSGVRRHETEDDSMKTFRLALAFLLTATLVLASDAPALFSGIVSDSECGLDHARMKKQHHLPNDLVCTRECCEKYKQDYVLADHSTGDIYQIDDQKAARRFANRLVRILGTLEAESGKIHLMKIEPVR